MCVHIVIASVVVVVVAVVEHDEDDDDDDDNVVDLFFHSAIVSAQSLVRLTVSLHVVTAVFVARARTRFDYRTSSRWNGDDIERKSKANIDCVAHSLNNTMLHSHFIFDSMCEIKFS